MTQTLNKELIAKITRRRPRRDTLTLEKRIALNLFWRDRVPVPVLAKVFKHSKNTIYYRALTGTADSYPTTETDNPAAETNAIIDRMGVEAAYKKYVTPTMIKAVNDEMEREDAARYDAR